jgi:hypothetical protein
VNLDFLAAFFGHSAQVGEECGAHRLFHIPSITRMKRKHLIWVLLVATAYVAIIVFGVRAEADGKAAQAELEEMFRAVRPMEGSSVHTYSSYHKSSACWVGSTSSGALQWANIRAYYFGELSQHGWRFVRAALQGRIIYFRKGGYEAMLVYEGDQPNRGWTYELGFSGH